MKNIKIEKNNKKTTTQHEALLLIDAKSIKAIISKFMADENTRAVIITDGEVFESKVLLRESRLNAPKKSRHILQV